MAYPDYSGIVSSHPESSLEDARRVLVDFIHHTEADCDAAARRLAGSHRHEDRTLGQEWLKMRKMEVAA